MYADRKSGFKSLKTGQLLTSKKNLIEIFRFPMEILAANKTPRPFWNFKMTCLVMPSINLRALESQI